MNKKHIEITAKELSAFIENNKHLTKTVFSVQGTILTRVTYNQENDGFKQTEVLPLFTEKHYKGNKNTYDLTQIPNGYYLLSGKDDFDKIQRRAFYIQFPTIEEITVLQLEKDVIQKQIVN